MSPQLQLQISKWRAAAAAGTLSEEDLIAAVREIREGRISAAKTNLEKKSKAKKEIPNADDFLAELMGGDDEPQEGKIPDPN